MSDSDRQVSPLNTEIWPIITLGNIAAIYSGATPSRNVPSYWDGDIPWVTPGELTNLRTKLLTRTKECITRAGLQSCAATLVPKNSLLVTTRATLGSVALAAMPVATNQGFRSLVFKSHADPHFFYHLSSRLTDEFTRRASGTTFLEISGREFAAVRVPLPALAEQHRIAEILDTLDETIRKTEQVIAKLQRMKQGLLHDLLTRGLDDNGELRDPERHPEQFKDSVLGRIPKEWGVPLIDDLAIHVGSGITPRGGEETYLSSGVLFIRSQNVHFDGLRLDDVAFIGEATHFAMARSAVFPNDVLLNITGASIGRCCPVPEGLGIANVNQHVCAIRMPNPTSVDAIFSSTFLASPFGQNQVNALNAGSNRQGLNYQQVRAFLVLWPEESEREKAVGFIVAHNDRDRQERNNLDKLRALKQGLMTDLLTGRVRIPQPEAALEPAM